MACQNYLRFKSCAHKVKFYWNIAISIYFMYICGCFHARVAELSICDKEHKALESLQHVL